MAGIPPHRQAYILDGSQQGTVDGNSGTLQSEPAYQEGYLYPVYGADGQPAYPPPPLFVNPSTAQYAGLQRFPQHDAAIRSIPDSQYTFHQALQSAPTPSVSYPPSQQLNLIPEQSDQPAYLVPQPSTANAPAINLEEWMSLGGPSSSVGSAKKPTAILKKPRQQFSACTACRIRRVKCDLKDLRVEWEKLHRKERSLEETPSAKTAESGLSASMESGKKNSKGKSNPKPNLAAISRKEDIQCTNCYNREAKCIDEFADRKPNRPRAPVHDGREDSKRRSGPQDQGSFSTRPAQSSEQATSTISSLVMNDADDRKSQVHSIHGGAQLLRPGLPRQHSGFSDPPDLYSPLEEKPIIEFPAEAQPPSAYNESDSQNTATSDFTGIPLSSSHQDFSESFIAEPSTFDYPYAWAPKGSKEAANTSHTDVQGIDFSRAVLSDPASIAASTPRSISSRGRSGGTSHSQHSSRADFRIPDLKPAFFESDFYRRFHIQRPIIDPIDFKNRYVSAVPHSASNMGPIGAILCHVLYAWASSYGVNDHGEPTIMRENWHLAPTANDTARQQQVRLDREAARQSQLEHTNLVVKQVLKEIDQAGVCRSMTWDGVRCLLLILPLTEYTSTSSERLAMYECALGQVFQLCSASALGYDGLPQTPDPEKELIRRRIYWYAFVHEGITTGLKGGRMVLDEDDLSSFEDVIPAASKFALTSSKTYKSVAKFASAPIRLAMACRLIHKALTGIKARRSERVDPILMNRAWEALEESWVEFDGIKRFSPGPLSNRDDLNRFADGWKIFMFEAHNVIRESLEHRRQILTDSRQSSRLANLSMNDRPADSQGQILLEVQRLRDIAQAKCDHLVKEIADIVKQHLHTPFFEWDASLVRDGTYYAATLLAEDSGTDYDIACCLQALSEMRWAFARSQERSDQLYRFWTQRPSDFTYANNLNVRSGERRFERSLDVLGTRSGLLHSFDSAVPAVSSLNNANHDFLSIVGEQQMTRDESTGLPNRTARPSVQDQQFRMDSIPGSTTFVTPVDFDHDQRHNYGASTSTNNRFPNDPRQDTDKLRGWTDQPLQYAGPSHGASDGQQWQNPYR